MSGLLALMLVLCTYTQALMAVGWPRELEISQHQVWLLAQESLPNLWVVLAHHRWGACVLAMAQCFEYG